MRGFWPVPVLLLAAIVYAACDPESGIRTWLRLGDDLRAAEERVAQVQDEVVALGHEARALDDDSFAMERAIRQDLGWARSGETVVRSARSSDSRPRFP